MSYIKDEDLQKLRLRHPSLPFGSLPYPTRTICRRVRTYVRSVNHVTTKRKEVDHIPWVWGSVPRALPARGSPAINLASEQKTTKLFFPSLVRKQFKLSLAVPFKSLRCCLRSDKLVNYHFGKFYKDLFLNFLESSWPDLSIKSYFLMVSSLILLGSLRVYILKQLFFSISVNSGFRNIYPATSGLGKYLATIYLNFKE